MEDRTGLAGVFDLDLRWAPEQVAPGGTPDAALPGLPTSIFTALQEQLGLKLEPASGSIDILVIDHAEHPAED